MRFGIPLLSITHFHPKGPRCLRGIHYETAFTSLAISIFISGGADPLLVAQATAVFPYGAIPETKPVIPGKGQFSHKLRNAR